jgi:hypothetical protein
VGLSESLCIAIVMVNLVKEMKGEHSANLPLTTPVVYCKFFEEKYAATVHLAKASKMRPCIKHINQKYYHYFQEWVKSVLIEILLIETNKQPVFVDEATQCSQLCQVLEGHAGSVTANAIYLTRECNYIHLFR